MSAYPAALVIDDPGPLRDRTRVLLRPLLALPILIILGLVSGGASEKAGPISWPRAGGMIVVATALMLVARQKYPRWWFDWNVALLGFSLRVTAYLALLRDEYPSTDEVQSVHLEIPYPDARQDLNRWLPLIKWFLAIPHWVVLLILCAAAAVAVILAWCAILKTGEYPRGLYRFVVAVFQWWCRVAAYAVLLSTDRYPPFALYA